MAKSDNLRKAKNAKNDEFYTQLTDVSKELMHYKQHFKNKTIFCNCDDPTRSAFWKYFHLNFSALGLKKLISTHYDKNEPTYKMEYTGGDDNDIEVGVKTPLEGNGDFRNQECLDLLDEADIVVTNPPFSLFREFLAWIMEAGKQFVIIGNKNAITYKEVFPLLKDNRIWVGTTAPKEFIIPATMTERKNTYIREDGTVIAKFGNICWFANIDHGLRHQPLRLDTMAHNLKFNKKLRRKLEKDYGKVEYPHYDNYDAIEIPFVECIPSDYDGVMGVPITFMDKYNPQQFDILGISASWDETDAMKRIKLSETHRHGPIMNGKKCIAVYSFVRK